MIYFETENLVRCTEQLTRLNVALGNKKGKQFSFQWHTVKRKYSDAMY